MSNFNEIPISKTCQKAVKGLQTMTITQKDYFWSFVKKTNKCWLWQGKPSRDGYGRLFINGIDFRAHRLAWALSGNAMTSRCLLHSCDNRKCVNPSHLREGTRGENAKDRFLRGRSAKGETHGSAKLTAKDVKRIRSMRAAKFKITEIAKIYNMSTSAIDHIVQRRNWAHI